MTGPIGNAHSGGGDYLASSRPRTGHSERQARSSVPRKREGSNLNLVELLDDGGNGQNPARGESSREYKIPRKAVGSKSSPRYEVFQGLKDKVAASMSKNRMQWKGSTRAQLLNEDPVTNPFLAVPPKSTTDGTQADQLYRLNKPTERSEPPASVRLSQCLPRIHLLHPSHLAKVESSYRRPAHLLPHNLQKPQGPRAAPVDRIASDFKEAHQRPRMQRQEGKTNIPQTSAKRHEDRQFARDLDVEVKGDGATISSCHICACAKCIHARAHGEGKRSVPSVGETVKDADELIQESGNEERSNCNQKVDQGADIAEERETSLAVKPGIVVHDVQGSNLTRTKSMLQRLDRMITIFSRADQNIQTISTTPYVKWVGLRLVEMIIHVFTTLNHASPALRVLRSPNARVGEYGSALRDFFRAIVYLVVLLNVLLLVARAVRFVVQVLTALALPVRLLCLASRWAFTG